jgi:PAS domain S-box-containing protein
VEETISDSTPSGAQPAPGAEELLALLFDRVEEYSLFFLTPDGRVSHWFPGAEHVYGYTAAEIVGQSGSKLFNEDDRRRGADQYELELARTLGRSEDDRWHVRKDGTLFWGSGVMFALHDAAGALIAFAKLSRNRTDVKTQTETLENRVKGLTGREERNKTFLATLAHELRNPLSPMAAGVQLIRQAGHADATTTAALQVIDRQIAALQRLVDDVLDTARVETGKIHLDMQVLDLTEVVEAAADACRPLAERRAQRFDVVVIPGAVDVRGDRQRLQQVLVNLLGNAIKYTPSGGRIALNLTTEGGDAIVRVEDNGVGMSADILPKVFDLFAQEDASLPLSAGGLGLGLALVRELVQLHEGTVQARSDGRDKGSVFTVRLPLHGTFQT